MSSILFSLHMKKNHDIFHNMFVHVVVSYILCLGVLFLYVIVDCIWKLEFLKFFDLQGNSDKINIKNYAKTDWYACKKQFPKVLAINFFVFFLESTNQRKIGLLMYNPQLHIEITPIDKVCKRQKRGETYCGKYHEFFFHMYTEKDWRHSRSKSYV
jgi:hypothetical protein